MATVKRTVTSSFIREVEYNPATKKLIVLFHNGKGAAYGGIEPGLFDDFLSAPSAGKFYTKRIKGKGNLGSVDGIEVLTFMRVLELFEGGKV